MFKKNSVTETLEIASVEELRKWALEFSLHFEKQTVVLFSGEVGAGKTESVKALVRALDGGEALSPTYSIHNAYVTPRGEIDHFDLYRLENDDDLESTGFWEVFAKDEGLIFIEWADRLDPSVYPKNWNVIRIEITKKKNQSTRLFQITKC